jgi:hypothetical protein
VETDPENAERMRAIHAGARPRLYYLSASNILTTLKFTDAVFVDIHKKERGGASPM